MTLYKINKAGNPFAVLHVQNTGNHGFIDDLRLDAIAYSVSHHTFDEADAARRALWKFSRGCSPKGDIVESEPFRKLAGLPPSAETRFVYEVRNQPVFGLIRDAAQEYLGVLESYSWK